MKKLILITISVFYSTLMFSQTFESLYNTPDDIIMEDFIATDSAYIFVGNKVASNTPIYVWYDMQGNFLKDSVDQMNTNWKLKNIIKLDSGFILLETNNLSQQKTIRVKVCDEEYRINNLFNINVSSSFFITNAKLLNDSILGMPGGMKDLNAQKIKNYTTIFFLNINNGEDTTIQTGTATLENFAADIFYLNEKYYVTQSTVEFYDRPNNSFTYAALSRWNTDFSLDTILPLYNSASDRSGKVGFFSIVSTLKLSDSTFMLNGRTMMDYFINSIGPAYDIGVVKLDTNFTELNAVTFGVKDSSALEAYQGLSRYENDSFLYGAGTERYMFNMTGFDTSTSYFMLSKMDLKGKVLWTRYYTNDTYLQMYKVIATSDGGAIMMGKSYDDKTANGLENDTWILKVDSNGNMNNTPTAVADNEEIPDKDFVFFPNPTRDYLTFRQINIMREYQLSLFDSNGKLIYQAEVKQSEKRIDVSNFAKGFYFYALTDEMGNQAKGKLIKQ